MYISSNIFIIATLGFFKLSWSIMDSVPLLHRVAIQVVLSINWGLFWISVWGLLFWGGRVGWISFPRLPDSRKKSPELATFGLVWYVATFFNQKTWFASSCSQNIHFQCSASWFFPQCGNPAVSPPPSVRRWSGSPRSSWMPHTGPSWSSSHQETGSPRPGLSPQCPVCKVRIYIICTGRNYISFLESSFQSMEIHIFLEK